MLATSQVGRVLLWDVTTGQQLHALTTGAVSTSVTRMAFSPRGGMLAVAESPSGLGLSLTAGP